MVKHGFTRAYASSLQKVIAANTSNRIKAFFAGLGVTTLLQSSTATTMVCASFASKRIIGTAAGIAVVIGANVGTTLVAQILIFDLSWLTPLLLFGGLILHHRFEHKGKMEHISRAIIGIGMVLLSLTLIKTSAAPLSQAEILPVILKSLENEPILVLIVTAIITWVLHSSMAAVLIISSFISSGIISLNLGLLLVLGANLGAAIAPFVMTYGMNARTRRITTGNLIMRLGVVFLIFPFLGIIMTFYNGLNLDISPPRAVVHFHTLFNILLATIFLPFVISIAAFCKKLIPNTKEDSTVTISPIYLDESVLNSPTLALACAARETLRVAKIVETMLTDCMHAFNEGNLETIQAIEKEDDKIDILHARTKFYLARITEEALDPSESDRFIQILGFSTNLEHIGDIIEQSLSNIISSKIKDRQHFSKAGFQEIQEFHQQVLNNMKIAQAVFMSEDLQMAQQLVESKKHLRIAANKSQARHFQRLRDCVPESQMTSTLHSDIIRDFKRINSYMTTVAYTILDKEEKAAIKMSC